MNNKSDSFEHYELISAYLDGEVTKKERAFIEESPDLLKEVDKLKEIKKVTSSLIPIDPILQRNISPMPFPPYQKMERLFHLDNRN